MYTKLDDLPAYKISNEISDCVWPIFEKWNYYAKNTVGTQLVRSVDSVATNIAEAFGRYHRKDKVKFYYNSRGSVYEAQFWLKKSRKRNLISEDEYNGLLINLRKLPKELNILIKWTLKNLKE